MDEIPFVGGSKPAAPKWRNEAMESVRQYQVGLDLLAEALDVGHEQLATSGITVQDLPGAGPRGILPITAVRTITTVDAVHALLSVGRIEQAEILHRTLIDLEIDTFLSVGDERAFGYYADWAMVEQARLALQLDSDSRLRPGRDLIQQRKLIAQKLVNRLEERGLADSLADSSGHAERSLPDLNLEEVLPEFCKVRFGSRRPASWRRGFQISEGLDRDDLHAVVVKAVSRTFAGTVLPRELRDNFEKLFLRACQMLCVSGVA